MSEKNENVFESYQKLKEDKYSVYRDPVAKKFLKSCPLIYDQVLFTTVMLGNTEKMKMRRRLFFDPATEWLTVVKAGHVLLIRNLIGSVWKEILDDNRPNIPFCFHSKTGIISKNLTEYLSGISSLPIVASFLYDYIDFMRGKSEAYPEDKGYLIGYRDLRTLSEGYYAKKLKKIYSGNEDSIRTQDFSILYRTPFLLLLDAVTSEKPYSNTILLINQDRG